MNFILTYVNLHSVDYISLELEFSEDNAVLQKSVFVLHPKSANRLNYKIKIK